MQGLYFIYARTHVKIMRPWKSTLNKIEGIYESLRVNVKSERGSTFTVTRDLPQCIAAILFTRVKFTCVRIKDSVTVEIHPKT